MTEPQDYLYCIFSGVGREGTQTLINEPTELPLDSQDANAFLPSEYPLCVLNGIAISSPPTLARGSARVEIVGGQYRGPMHFWEGSWVTEFANPSIIIDGIERPAAPKTSVESVVCRYTSLIVPQFAVDDFPVFATTHRDMHFTTVPAAVALTLRRWGQVPHYLSLWEQTFQSLGQLRPQDLGYDSLTDHATKASIEVARARLEQEANVRGPAEGSVLPCGLRSRTDGSWVHCMLEILELSRSDYGANCVAYLLNHGQATHDIRGSDIYFHSAAGAPFHIGRVQ